MRTMLMLALVLGLAAPALAAYEAVLTWQDNATNEATQDVERALGAAAPYAVIGTVGANVTTFTDPGPYTDGQVVCWRVVAANAGGRTTGPATCEGAPVQAPAGPGAPSILWRVKPGP